MPHLPPRKPAPKAAAPRGKGFAAAGALVQARIGAASRARGFALTRVLTHWSEIVGRDIAALCRPARITHGRGGMGATLVLLVRGASAPLVQAQAAQIRDKVNACYGHNAVSRVRLTQTAPAGFAEPAGPAYAGPAPGAGVPARAAPETRAAAEAAAETVRDPALRAALAELGTQVLSTRSRHSR